MREYSEQRFVRRFWPFYCGVPLVFLTLAAFDAEALPGGLGFKVTRKNQSKPTVQAEDSETANWRTLKNKYGWKIKYPPNWLPAPNPEAAPALSGLVEFRGPGDCGKERCAYFQINSDINQGKVKDPPEDDTEPKTNDPNLFFRRRVQLGGFPAIDACWYEPKTSGGQLARGIAIFHKGREIEITYIEGGPDKTTIKAPIDWKYVGTFNKILSTMSFYDVSDSVWPSQ